MVGLSLLYTLMPGDYNSFAMVILNWNHREIDIAESVSVSIKVYLPVPMWVSWKWHYGDSLDMDNMASSLACGGVENCHFWLGGQFPSKFDIVIPKTPLYKGMVVWILK